MKEELKDVLKTKIKNNLKGKLQDDLKRELENSLKDEVNNDSDIYIRHVPHYTFAFAAAVTYFQTKLPPLNPPLKSQNTDIGTGSQVAQVCMHGREKKTNEKKCNYACKPINK